jgi:hypothetical protein
MGSLNAGVTGCGGSGAAGGLVAVGLGVGVAVAVAVGVGSGVPPYCAQAGAASPAATAATVKKPLGLTPVGMSLLFFLYKVHESQKRPPAAVLSQRLRAPRIPCMEATSHSS